MGTAKTKKITGFRLPEGISAFIWGILLFLAVAAFAELTIKPAVIICLIVLVNVAAYHFGILRRRIYIPLIALAAYVLLDGISAFYAEFGKIALTEYLKVFGAFCTALILLILSPEEEKVRGRWIGTVLAVCTAIGSLLSIDLLSTRWLSGLFSAFFGLFSNYYDQMQGVEPGVRMLSIFDYPNCFAAFAGIGALISLGLADTVDFDTESSRKRVLPLVLLFINSLGFFLVFGLGAMAFMAVAFLVYVLFQPRESRARVLVLMAEDLLICLPCVFLISVTSFQWWKGFQPVPILCVIIGSAALVLLHLFIGIRLIRFFESHMRAFLTVVVAVILLIVVYAVAAWHLTGPALLSPGETLSRAFYPEPGEYTLHIDADSDISVTIESQTKKEALMRSGTTLYRGADKDIPFTVPEESAVVYVNFNAQNGGTIRSAVCEGNSVSYSISLEYKLMPRFIARRLQGLRVNENALQRTVFFDDAIKIIKESPVIGHGIGGFENRIRSVQSYYYVTKYAHNHYLESLVQTGIIGLLFFLAMLGSSIAAVIRKRFKDKETVSLIPMLSAAAFFIAGHAVTDVDFSFYAVLPIIFGVLMMINLCCGDQLPVPSLKVKKAAVIVTVVFSAVFTVFTIMNLYVRHTTKEGVTIKSLDYVSGLDYFEWPDDSREILNYVTQRLYSADENERAMADKHAEKLKGKNLYSSFAAAEYYFATGKTQEAFQVLERFVDYVRSEDSSWDKALALLDFYESEDEEYLEGVRRIIEKLDAWNEINWGQTVLMDETADFVNRMREKLGIYPKSTDAV